MSRMNGQREKNLSLMTALPAIWQSGCECQIMLKQASGVHQCPSPAPAGNAPLVLKSGPPSRAANDTRTQWWLFLIVKLSPSLRRGGYPLVIAVEMSWTETLSGHARTSTPPSNNWPGAQPGSASQQLVILLTVYGT